MTRCYTNRSVRTCEGGAYFSAHVPPIRKGLSLLSDKRRGERLEREREEGPVAWEELSLSWSVGASVPSGKKICVRTRFRDKQEARSNAEKTESRDRKWIDRRRSTESHRRIRPQLPALASKGPPKNSGSSLDERRRRRRRHRRAKQNCSELQVTSSGGGWAELLPDHSLPPGLWWGGGGGGGIVDVGGALLDAEEPKAGDDGVLGDEPLGGGGGLLRSTARRRRPVVGFQQVVRLGQRVRLHPQPGPPRGLPYLHIQYPAQNRQPISIIRPRRLSP